MAKVHAALVMLVMALLTPVVSEASTYVRQGGDGFWNAPQQSRGTCHSPAAYTGSTVVAEVAARRGLVAITKAIQPRRRESASF
jgi:hypothetical protein